MSTHIICFRGEIRKVFIGYPPLFRPMLHEYLCFGISLDSLAFLSYCYQSVIIITVDKGVVPV